MVIKRKDAVTEISLIKAAESRQDRERSERRSDSDAEQSNDAVVENADDNHGDDIVDVEEQLGNRRDICHGFSDVVSSADFRLKMLRKLTTKIWIL